MVFGCLSTRPKPATPRPAAAAADTDATAETAISLRDDVLGPLLEEVGACGNLARAAAVCKAWAAVSKQVWPIVVKRWTTTLREDLVVARPGAQGTTGWNIGIRLMHAKSASALTVVDPEQETPPDQGSISPQYMFFEPSVVVDDGIVKAEWKQTASAVFAGVMVAGSSEQFAMLQESMAAMNIKMVNRIRRSLTLSWDAGTKSARLAWAGDAEEVDEEFTPGRGIDPLPGEVDYSLLAHGGPTLVG